MMNQRLSEPFKFFMPIKVRCNESDLRGRVNFGHYQ